MKATATFDTLAYAKKLREAGVPENQAEIHAEALAELIEERLATKQDLKELEGNIKRDLKELEMKLTIRMGVMLAATIAILATLIKLL